MPREWELTSLIMSNWLESDYKTPNQVLDDLLNSGWEPYAVTYESNTRVHHLRRHESWEDGL